MAAFVAFCGFTGYQGMKNVTECLHQVGEEEAPVLELANEMKLSLMTSRNLLEEYKAATAVLSTENESSLGEIRKKFTDTIKAFDKGCELIRQGGINEGEEITATDNPLLRDLIDKSDKLHNEKFQTSSMMLMNLGEKLIVERKTGDSAMEEFETNFKQTSDGADGLETLISAKISALTTSAITEEELHSVLARTPWVDAAMELKNLLLHGRICIEEMGQTTNMDDLRKLEISFNEYMIKFDNLFTALIKGGKHGTNSIIAMDDPAMVKAAVKFDEVHSKMQKSAAKFMKCRENLVNLALKTEQEMENLDTIGEQAAELITKAEEQAWSEMVKARNTGKETVSLSEKTLAVSLAASLGLGCFMGIMLTRSITIPINGIIEMLGKNADQVSYASNQVAAASEEMSAGATEQASSLEEISSSLEELSATVNQTAGNNREAEKMMVDTSSITMNGSRTMTEMNQAIESISNSSEQTSRIIKTIDEIAFQTNLLALNAAVEAARAGESGKGFAVVAEEVRNLAQRSAEAARNTTHLINDSVVNSRKGVEVSTQVTEIFNTISDRVEKVTSLIREISVASGEQSNNISQINEGMSALNTVTQSGAASTEETAAASEELSSQALELMKMVEALESLVKGARKV
jgi:methyl-accepting chemotaxis protein